MSNYEQTLCFGSVQIKPFLYVMLLLSAGCSALTSLFVPNEYVWIILIFIGIHLLIALAIYDTNISALYGALGLISFFYLAGMISIILFMILLANKNHQSSFNLNVMHASALSGLWTNVLLGLMVGFIKLISVTHRQNSYEMIA